MKLLPIALFAAGILAGPVSTVLAADDVKSDSPPAETSQSRSSDPMSQDSMNDKSKADTGGMHDKGDAMFKKADRDGDGTLDRKEAKKMPRVSKNFDAIDTDKDGTVSLDEVHTYMSAHPSKNGKM